eukprot:IDg3625t1
MIEEFLIGKAKALYNNVVLSNRTSTGVPDYCTAVNWLIPLFDTDENINKAIEAFLQFLFINEHDARLRNAVHTFIVSHPKGDLRALLENAERECSTIRAILGSALKRNLPAMPGSKPETVRIRTSSTVVVVAPPCEPNDPRVEKMIYSKDYSFLAEELPSTEQESEGAHTNQQEEERNYLHYHAVEELVGKILYWKCVIRVIGQHLP